MIEIKRALISVYKKDGILDLAKALIDRNIEILSTGGTAKLLKNNNIPVTTVEDYTQFPEMMDGRVKTLHPKIHAGILARRDNKDDIAKLDEFKIKRIDLVVVNLYPFQEVTQKEDLELNQAIEFIDIGGPTMIRAAAKNYKHVVTLSNVDQYKDLVEELDKKGVVSEELALKFAKDVFSTMALYDKSISSYLGRVIGEEEGLINNISINLKKKSDLRYGENSHQRAALYEMAGEEGLAGVRKLSGKELSFNNWLDLDAASISIASFKEPAAVVIKHNNPCGLAIASNIKDAFIRANESDSLSAFGGIVGLNREVTLTVAEAIIETGFKECIIAPGYSKDALSILSEKKNLRIMETDFFSKDIDFALLDFRRVQGGFLVQDRDSKDIERDDLKVVTKKIPEDLEIDALLFAWRVVAKVKSNAIVLVRDFSNKTYATVGIGAGQASRVDSVIISIRKAGDRSRGAVLASDAFFPMADSIDIAQEAGITAIIQPGGSIKDKEVIEKADELGLAMVFTSIRHFRH
ncbi:MAG: bifunctional phosphoribosylaminoimidazolecarboxamide formyltransferase/IMP cyclohydrolase [Candidatus Kaelpia aquatica]|nr:bifunctional phosphoribosylaminoimidazolecarboxamide formyltransferase/IMP cyclohydrolase [Candidatus Kaelpia aquatica]